MTNFEGPQRADPAFRGIILLQLGTYSLLPLAVAGRTFYLIGIGWGFSAPSLALALGLFVLGVAGLLFITTEVTFRRQQFQIGPQELTVMRGVWFPRTWHVARTDIAGVRVTRTFWHRRFGLASIRVERRAGKVLRIEGLRNADEVAERLTRH